MQYRSIWMAAGDHPIAAVAALPSLDGCWAASHQFGWPLATIQWPWGGLPPNWTTAGDHPMAAVAVFHQFGWPLATIQWPWALDRTR